jgi:hypothetical protein
MKKVQLLLPLMLAFIVSCDRNDAAEQHVSPSPEVAKQQVLIDPMTTVPNINGASSAGVLYIHNYAKTIATKVLLSASASAQSSDKDGGITLVNPEQCSSIPAGGFCAVKFITPTLDLANSGNSLVKLSYQQDNISYTTSKVVSYSYVALEQRAGVNFIGDVAVNALAGEKRHAVGYLYAAGKTGDIYKDVTVKMSSPSASVKAPQAFSHGRDIAVGSVIPVEFEINMQSSHISAAQAYASWGNDQQSGNIVQLTVDPIPNGPNYMFGAAATMSAPSVGTNEVGVINNGSGDGINNITAAIIPGSGVNENDLIINQGCAETILLKNAANSCQIGFSVTAKISGNTTVEYRAGEQVVSTQQISWIGKTAVPIITMIPSTRSVQFNKGDIQPKNAISLTITNKGTAPQENTVATAKASNPSALKWTEDSNSCPSTLNPASTCTISGHMEALDAGSGQFFYALKGSYNGANYNRASLPVAYEVIATPLVDIVRDSESPMTVLANGVNKVTKTFTVTNHNSIVAHLLPAEISFVTQTATKPTVLSDGCNGKSLGNEQSCQIVLQYGPIPVTQIENEEGTASLVVHFTGLSTDPNTYSVMNSIDYKVYANDINVTISQPTVVNLTGIGTSESPFIGTAKAQPSISFSYTNSSAKFDLKNFNVAKNMLPLGTVVDPASDCPVGSKVGTLKAGASCTLIIVWDRDLLISIPTADSVMNFIVTPPKASWSTTEFGSGSKTSSDVYNVTYQQPKITATSQQVAKTMQLNLTAVNLEAGSQPLGITISGVKGVTPIDTAPTIVSGNCAVNQNDFSISCANFDQAIQISYAMPAWLAPGQVVNISMDLTINGSYAVADSIVVMNYVAPQETFTWNQVSGGDISGTSQITTIVKKDSNIYAAGASKNYKAAVWVYSGTQWSQLGNADISTVYLFNDLVASQVNNNLYAVGMSTSKFGAVWQWNGSAWSQLGVDLALTKNLASIATDASGNIYVAGISSSNDGIVFKWNGSSWSQLGSNLSQLRSLNKLVITEDGSVYVSGQSSTSIRGAVWRWSGSNWAQVGGDVSDAYTIDSMVFDSAGNLYGGGLHTSNAAAMWKWDGSVWSLISSGPISGSSGTVTDMVIDGCGTIYIASQVKTSTYYGAAWSWNGVSWKQLGNSYVSSASSLNSLLIDSSGDIYAGGNSINSAGGLWRAIISYTQ